MPRPPKPHILPCPRLVVKPSGTFFRAMDGRMHDLGLESTMRTKEAASDIRLCGMAVKEITRAIRSHSLYPVLQKNRRVLLIFDCALTDWRARAVRPVGHLFENRSKAVA